MQPDRTLDEVIVAMRQGHAMDGRHPRSASSDAAPAPLPEVAPEALRHLARLLGRQAAREALRVRRHGGLGMLPVGVVLGIVAVALAAVMWVAPHLHIGAWP